MKIDTDPFPNVTNNMVNFQRLFGSSSARRQDVWYPKVKVEVQHSDVGLKIRPEVIHTYPNCHTNFMDKPFKFPKKLKTYKPPLVHDQEWHEH